MSATHKIQLRKGKEPFVDNGKPVGLTLLDYWQYQHSNIFNNYDSIAEFLVGKALGLQAPTNKQYWTLWDIDYCPDWLEDRMVRVEVKETSYYHPWSENHISKARTFSIAPGNLGYYEEHARRIERQCDIYVFCLNVGETKEESYPLDVNNWEFYVVPTRLINEKCYRNQKTITLGRIRNLEGIERIPYEGIKEEVDRLIREGIAEAHPFTDDGIEFHYEPEMEIR